LKRAADGWVVVSRRRAVLAAAVAAVGGALFVAGLGHAYLREWRRAAAWFATVVGAMLVLVVTFADPRTVTLSTLPVTVLGPLVALSLASVVDAYRVGRRADRETAPTCPHCGRVLDADLDFCPWCTRAVDRTVDPDADVDPEADAPPARSQ
jgi:peptidoglycan/LPS O-acetylase OafA/YrhL